ncbi:MAG: hypothetical protein E6G68_06830 [Actinobacteria bacterium]|nr:MAG: hypothetical protein E6G68_06830 [Actinomycetota bacterium]
MVLLGLTCFRIRSVYASFRSARKEPFLLLCFVYLGLFVVAFSTFANFGLLARERSQALPFLFVLLAVDHRRNRDRDLARA